MRKYFTFLLLFVAVILAPIMVTKAESSNVAKIGEMEYATLEEAIAKANAGETITLLADANMAAGQVIQKNLILNLNGHNVMAPSKVFSIENANFTIEGKGMISEGTADYAPIYLKGSTDSAANNYTVVNIGSDVTLRGWSGIFIAQNSTNAAYGVVVNLNGTISNVNAEGENYKFTDAKGDIGAAIYVNGSIQKMDGNVPVIHLNGATIQTQGPAIYAAGFAKWNIENSNIVGEESGIGAKAGIFDIRNSTLKATGKFVIPPADNNNGIEGSGAALQLESNKDYVGNMEIKITNSQLISEQGVAICEYLTTGVDSTKVNSIEINGGTYVSNDENYGVFALSDSFMATHSKFITAGTFSSDVSKYVPAGYSTLLNQDGNFVVNKVVVEEGTYTITGKVITTKENVLVQLKQGGKVLQATDVKEDGTYVFTKVAAGVYNVVAVSGDASTMVFVNVANQNVESNVTLGSGNVNVVVGQKTPDVVVEGLEILGTDKNVSLEVAVATNSSLTKEQTLIKEKINNKGFDFIDISLLIENVDTKEIGNVLKIVVPYSINGKTNITLSRYHDGEVNQFNKLSVLPTEKYVDGTYYVDSENNLMYIFTSKFSTYAIGYDEVSNTVSNPDTIDGIVTYMVVGFISFIVIGVVLILFKKRNVNLV